jgi:GNAT superfamily N-acetyltransferase
MLIENEQIPHTSYTLHLDEHDAFRIIYQRLFEFNRHHVPSTQSPDIIHKNIIVKNGNDIIGGICSDIYLWKILYVNVIFVDEDYRHQGIGSLLLRKVEEEAIAIGSHLAHLDTFDWQAKDFYIKQGYEVFGELDDCPLGHKRFYMKKVLK